MVHRPTEIMVAGNFLRPDGDMHDRSCIFAIANSPHCCDRDGGAPRWRASRCLWIQGWLSSGCCALAFPSKTACAPGVVAPAGRLGLLVGAMPGEMLELE